MVGLPDRGAMYADAASRLAMIDETLRRATHDDLLLMHYQPRVRVADAAIVGFEALMRLRSPDGELLAPHEFLARADELALLAPLEDAALAEVCRQASDWSRRGRPLGASLNVSATRVRDFATFEPVVRDVLDETGLSPKRLTLEISETTLVDVSDETVRGLRRLIDIGVAISVDDFGATPASTAYLRSLPIHEIKIDRSFTAATPGDRSATALVRAYATLARELGIRCVAEGIETGQQHAYLVATGIEFAQGYYYERPLPASSFYELIKAPTGVVEGRQ